MGEPPAGVEFAVDAAILAAGGVDVAVDGPIVTVTLARPEARNAQTPATWRALAAVGDALVPGVRVVVLRAEGKSFSAGLDRRMLTEGLAGEASILDLANVDAAAFDAQIAIYQRAFTWWRESDAITIAAVAGHAIGAGFQLALGADLMIVGDDVALSMRETQLGLVPDLAGTWPLVEAVGYSRALEICVTGRWVGADEAVASGIAAAAVPRDELDDAVRGVVATILAAPAGAVTETKQLLRPASGRTRQEQCDAERLAQRRRVVELAQLLADSQR